MGAGKSTVAKALAKRLGVRYVDTGAMYRSVALLCLRRGVSMHDADAVIRVAEGLDIAFSPGSPSDRVLLGGEDVTEAIRAPDVSDGASIVSTIPRVRAVMVARQKALGREGGVVMEGRDIGTVVFPDAEVKVFLHASPEARARRRYEEFRARGATITFEEILRAQTERDRRDATRPLSPMRPAPDAVVIDSTVSNVDQVVDRIVRLVRERTGVV
jgi:cytidylate kinase